MSEMEKVEEYLRANMLPRLNMILDFAEEVLETRREAAEGEFREEPSAQEKFFVAQLCVTLLATSGIAAQSGQGAPGKGISITPLEYREVEGPWKNLIAEEGFDLKAWTHLEELLIETVQGQSILLALIGMAIERAKEEEPPPG